MFQLHAFATKMAISRLALSNTVDRKLLVKVKPGAHEAVLLDRLNCYVYGIKFYAILVGGLKSGNVKLS